MLRPTLIEKNLFVGIVIEINEDFVINLYLKVSSRGWVSQNVVLLKKSGEKLRLKTSLTTSLVLSDKNVNKNVNKALSSSVRRLLEAFKLQEALKSLNYCKRSTKFPPLVPFSLTFLLSHHFPPLLSRSSRLSLTCFSHLHPPNLPKPENISMTNKALLLIERSKNCTTPPVSKSEKISTVKKAFKVLKTKWKTCETLVGNNIKWPLASGITHPEKQYNKPSAKRTYKENSKEHKLDLVSGIKHLAFNQPAKNLISLRTFRNDRHRELQIKTRLTSAKDVELNPGPERTDPTPAETKGKQVEVISYNVRGLKDTRKLRHLVNYCYGSKLNKNKDSFFCFQETYIENPSLIPYLWRGNYYLTPGVGNSSGCLTLLSHHLNVIHSRDIDNRAHVLVCQKTDDPKASYILANIYAPNVNNVAKINFFENVLNAVAELEATYNCQRTIVAGDFNLIFHSSEAKNRNFSAQEQNVARAVKVMLDDLNLKDLMEKSKEFTWRRPNSEHFSKIDKIYCNKSNLSLASLKTNWAVSLSDHAAIEVSLSLPGAENGSYSKITRLDATLFNDPEIKENIIRELVVLQDMTPREWDPHLKLEYLKMSIRTVMEKAQADRKKREKSEEELLNVELDLAVKSLAKDSIPEVQKNELIELIEELRIKKDLLVDKKGQRLAAKLGTKWYNEGEKSTRYFLRILQRNSPDNFKELIKEDGSSVTEPTEIEKEVVQYYKNLYENYDKSVLVDNDNTFFDEISEIPEAERGEVDKPITENELWSIIQTCSDSSPGPDGISYSVWKELWAQVHPTLLEAWHFSIRVGKLPPSHRTSFLKLIPKQGKDIKKLTNWRPITLSNCDHKIFTKLYSVRICNVVNKLISENQTAYLKGRLINDNIRSLIASIQIAATEEDIDAVLVSLDARKAFDSVEHSYIRKCLSCFGLSNFLPIFDTLYSNLSSDVIINGKIVKGFNILRGVKQGDALSCVIFIMCVEPLLRNLNKNNAICPIVTATLGTLPKNYAYADDINCFIRNDRNSLQMIFTEYERLSKISGLILNADKTEILTVKSPNLRNDNPNIFRINYLGERHQIEGQREVKVNGIYLCQEPKRLEERNVEAVCEKINSQFGKWSRRSLSVLGKILIVKTFGISQIIYLLQSMSLCEPAFKKFNHLLYKFVWNKHYQAAKAPERIKREIVNKPITLGGFGMLDIRELDDSLKLKALGRLASTQHPLLAKIKDKLNLNEFFYPSCTTGIEGVAARGVELLKKDRQKLWDKEGLTRNRTYVWYIRQLELRRIISATGKSSLIYFNLRHRGKTKVDQLNLTELRSLERFMNPNLLTQCYASLRINPGNLDTHPLNYFTGKMFTPVDKLCSKDLRVLRADPTPICLYKIGAIMTPDQALAWGLSVSKITSTRHKDTLLRLMHGELYTKERLYRFNLTDTPNCPRCGDTETLEHKFITCDYVKEIWRRTILATNQLRTNIDPGLDPLDAILCTSEPDPKILTIHAEILLKIRQLDQTANHLTLPRIVLRKTVERVQAFERKQDFKNLVEVLFGDNG